MPGTMRDSVPSQKPAGTAATVKAHDEESAPNLELERRSDAIDTVVEAHLQRHRLLRLRREE
jgi:hypothetical protein